MERYIDPSGYDAGKKIKGKKRHILVDTVGLLGIATKVSFPPNVAVERGAANGRSGLKPLQPHIPPAPYPRRLQITPGPRQTGSRLQQTPDTRPLVAGNG